MMSWWFRKAKQPTKEGIKLPNIRQEHAGASANKCGLNVVHLEAEAKPEE